MHRIIHMLGGMMSYVNGWRYSVEKRYGKALQ